MFSSRENVKLASSAKTQSQRSREENQKEIQMFVLERHFKTDHFLNWFCVKIYQLGVDTF